MSPARARYVTACQQLLALGVVVMALVPATRVISLDVVGVSPGQGSAQPTISVSPTVAPEVGMSGYARAKQRCAMVSTRVVESRSATPGRDRPCREVRRPGVRTRAGTG